MPDTDRRFIDYWPTLTVYQPYASALVTAPADTPAEALGRVPAVKQDENRTWGPSSRVLAVGDWLAVHAGARLFPGADRLDFIMTLYGRPPIWRECPVFDQLPVGAVIGAVRFAGTRTPEQAANPWATGPVCWHFDRAFALAQPIAAKGLQQVWRLRDPVAIAALRDGVNRSEG